MAQSRTQGANARQISWEEAAGAPAAPRRNNWLPLDALDDEMYAATPQLQAMPNTRRQAAPPPPTRQYAPMSQAHTMSQRLVAAIPGTQAHPRQNEQAGRAQGQGLAVSKAQAKALAMLAGGMITLMALYVVLSAAVQWVQVKLDDFQYGRPRTSQMDAYVGHGEREGSPSHFIAMNLNRRVTILQLPGGDSTRATAIVGPYLFGQGEDLTPVQMNVQDVNLDSKPDLVVTVKSEQLLYLNDGSTFKMATPEEQAAIQKALAARNGLPAKDGQGVQDGSQR